MRRESFSQRRRSQLAVRPTLIDEVLEPRSLITEPVSLAAQAFGLPLMLFSATQAASRGRMRSSIQGRDVQVRKSAATGFKEGGARSAVVPTRRPAGGWAPAASEIGERSLSRARAIVGLDHRLAAPPNPASGESAPLIARPAVKAAGGAQASRGAAGNGGQAAVAAAAQGRVVQSKSLAASEADSRPGGAQAAAASFGALSSAISISPAGGSGLGADAPSPGMLNSGAYQNASSLPYSLPGGGVGASMASFAYFPMYVVDQNAGAVLFPGQYSLAPGMATFDLRAQVRDTTVSTYSWDTSNLGMSGVTGASTYRLQFSVPIADLMTSRLRWTTLTVTNAGGQSQSQTFYFFTPKGGDPVVGVPGGSSWAETIAPDTVRPESSQFASHYVTVDANSGSLDATINLPSYSPNIPGLSLAYDSSTADPRPIIIERHALDPSLAVPSKVSAQLTFDGTAGTTYYYNTSQFVAGDVQQIPLQLHFLRLHEPQAASRSRRSAAA
jgi:hypothetical protein